MFYLYKWISSLLKKTFEEVYYTIFVLHGTAISKIWMVQESNIAVSLHSRYIVQHYQHNNYKITIITKTCLTNHKSSISHHITPLVINSLGGGHTHMQTSQTKVISRNQACTGLQTARAWFKKHLMKYIVQYFYFMVLRYQKIGRYRKVISWYDYIASILLNTTTQ